MGSNDDAFGLYQRWLRYLEVSGRCNENTRIQYARCWIAFAATVYGEERWTGPRDLLGIDEDDAVSYIRGWTKAQGGRRGLVLRALRSFYAFAEDREAVGRSPFRHLLPRNPKYGEAPSLTRAETTALIRAARHVDPRFAPALTLQFLTGARVGSLIALTPADLHLADPRGPWLHFAVAKGDDPYDAVLGASGVAACRELLELIDYAPKRGKRRPTLIGVGYEQYRVWLKDAAARAGLDADRVRTHLIRHTTATRLAENPETSFRTIMATMNWKDPRMIDRYARKSHSKMRAAQRDSLEPGLPG